MTRTAPPSTSSERPPGAVSSGWRGGGFVSRSSLPSDPTARRHERRGRLWLVASFVLCPCHLPVTMALIGVALGGTAVGSVLSGQSVAVGVVMGVLYGLGLWRGFRHLRRAKARLAPGERLSCTDEGCEIVPGAPTSAR